MEMLLVFVVQHGADVWYASLFELSLQGFKVVIGISASCSVQAPLRLHTTDASEFGSHQLYEDNLAPACNDG